MISPTVIRIVENLKALYEMAHILGPNGEAWDLQFELYPEGDRPHNIARWAYGLSLEQGGGLYGKKDGKIYRMQYGGNAVEVSRIPIGAIVLPEYWTDFLKTGN